MVAGSFTDEPVGPEWSWSSTKRRSENRGLAFRDHLTSTDANPLANASLREFVLADDGAAQGAGLFDVRPS